MDEAYAQVHEPSGKGRALLQVYFCLRSSYYHDGTPEHDLLGVVHRVCDQISFLDEDLVGLHEHIGVDHMAWDYRVRRSHLLREMARLQAHPFLSRATKEAAMATTSRLTSRASRYYALLVARLAAMQSSRPVDSDEFE